MDEYAFTGLNSSRPGCSIADLRHTTDVYIIYLHRFYKRLKTKKLQVRGQPMTFHLLLKTVSRSGSVCASVLKDNANDQGRTPFHQRKKRYLDRRVNTLAVEHNSFPYDVTPTNVFLPSESMQMKGPPLSP